MTRWIASCALLIAAASTVSIGQSPQSTATRLLVDAVAVDRQGMPVTNLKAEDLEGWVGHFRMPLESLAAVTPGSDERGRLVVLVLDDVTLPLPLLARVKEAARRFVSRMSPDDRMAVVTLNGAAMEATDDRSRLFRAIDDYTVRATGVLRLDTLGQHVLTTITTLARQMAEGPDQRKTIVAIGSGGLLDRPLPPPQAGRDLLPEWIDAMRMLSIANAAYYVIDPAGVGGNRVGGGDSGFAR